MLCQNYAGGHQNCKLHISMSNLVYFFKWFQFNDVNWDRFIINDTFKAFYLCLLPDCILIGANMKWNLDYSFNNSFSISVLMLNLDSNIECYPLAMACFIGRARTGPPFLGRSLSSIHAPHLANLVFNKLGLPLRPDFFTLLSLHKLKLVK